MNSWLSEISYTIGFSFSSRGKLSNEEKPLLPLAINLFSKSVEILKLTPKVNLDQSVSMLFSKVSTAPALDILK